METLGDLQRKMALITGKLIIYAYEQGYELTMGEGQALSRLAGRIPRLPCKVVVSFPQYPHSQCRRKAADNAT